MGYVLLLLTDCHLALSGSKVSYSKQTQAQHAIIQNLMCTAATGHNVMIPYTGTAYYCC